MRCFLILLILLIFFQSVYFQTPVSVLVVKQENLTISNVDQKDTKKSSSIFKFPERDVFSADRRITFKVTNESNDIVVLYGEFFNNVFFPSGYMLERDKTIQKWDYPEIEKRSERINHLKKQSKMFLEPKTSLSFVTSMSHEGNKTKVYKRVIYFSIKGNYEPMEASSSEFSLE